MSKVASKLNKTNKSLKKAKTLKFKVKSKQTAKTQTAVKTKAKVSKAKVAQASKVKQEKELIVIDESQGLIFENDKTLFGFFSEQIKYFENRYDENYVAEKDFSDEEMLDLENWLEATLDDPDEIWVDNDLFSEFPIYTLVKTIHHNGETFDYVAVVYINSEEKYPSFVFLHFPTKDSNLTHIFREKELLHHRRLEAIQFAAIEGDSLLEGDTLAIGLLESMMKLRSENDVPHEKFQNYAEFRDETINSPDEIWRKVGSEGHTLVTFIRDISESTTADMHYVAVTEEDAESEVHSLLFSFPTNDSSLLERYRQGENLEAEEVSTESAH